MRLRALGKSTAVTLALVAASTAALVAQAPARPTAPPVTTLNTDAAIKVAAEATRAAASLKAWTPLRTPWGDPDFSGLWLTATYTPLQRPPELESKAFYTEEEAVAVFKKAVETDDGVDPRIVHYDWKEYGMEAWQAGTTPNLRTSLIVDPENGRMPPFTPEGQKRRAAAAVRRDTSDYITTLANPYTRCIVGGGGVPLVRGGTVGSESAATAAGVTAEALFFQSPQYVTIVMQMNNDVRVIPLDGRPHVPAAIRKWLGDSRGRWEGNTLVVETTNFNNKFPATNFQGSSEELRVVERFTRIGPNMIRYQYTVTDPTTWTQPWSVDAQMPRVEPSMIYEFACHEQNYGLFNMVRGTQIREREAAARGGTANTRPAGGGER